MKGGVRGVPETEKPLEISVKTVRKFGKNRKKNAQKWTKPRTVGMLGTEKPLEISVKTVRKCTKLYQNFGKTEQSHKISPGTAKPQISDTPGQGNAILVRMPLLLPLGWVYP